jgi:2-oxoglutarate dehydrogenase E2 component (dihydrolipoamide succinyltransferase)
MIVDVKVPEVGESITEGVLVSWSVEEGDVVAADDPLFELETDKITLTVQAQEGGKVQILVEAGEKVTVGQVVAKIDTAGAGEAKEAALEPGKPAPDPNLDQLAPAVRRLVAEHGLDPAAITGTGRDGRLTKEDVLTHLQRAQQVARPPAATTPAEKPTAPKAPPARPPAAPKAPPADRSQTRRPMSSLRQRIAQRLVEAQHNAAMLTTFNEADMSAVMALRAEHRAAFEERHGVRLGFMSFFVKAAVDALGRAPVVNAQLDGDTIVENHYYDIGVAVATDAGLVVPVIRDADRLGFAELELAIADFAARARERRLELSELTGGTFTISNGGVYGSLLSTPILNPPQSAILGLHAIKRRPVVVEGDRVEVRPMMYLALSYDHRLVDGKEAVTFLKRIVECIERPERLLLEV